MIKSNEKYKNNELIMQRRKKMFRKKCLLLMILLLTVLFTLCFKLPIFNIKNIDVTNNKNISKKEILKLSDVYCGNNIFYVDFNKIKDNILSNPYINKVEIKMKLPNTLIINVTERKIDYYLTANNNNIIIDSDGIVVENKKSIGNMKLTKLSGISAKKFDLGKQLDCDDIKKIQAIKTFSKFVTTKDNKFRITSIDLTDLTDIKVYYNNMCVKIGDTYNLKNKLNKAINILIGINKEGAKGYIDVSYDGNPVFSIEK